MRTMALLLSGLCLSPVSVRAGGETCAIMDFTASNASASEAVAISSFVRNAVVRSGMYTVVDKKNMDRILQEQAFQQTGCTSQECAVKLGKLLNVKRMIVGEYTLLGGTRFLTASLVNVESSEIERSGKVKGFEVANADEAADQLVAQLEGKEAPPSTPPAQPAYTPPPDNSYAKQAYVASPVARGPQPKSFGYMAFYAGPTLATKLTGLTRTSDYTWSSGPYSGDKLYTFTYSDIEMQSTGPGFGLKIGGGQGPVGGEFEISHVAMTNVVGQSVNVTTTGEYYVPGYGYVAYNDYSFSAQKELLNVSAWTFAGNLILAIPDSKFSPYIGIGIGFAAMNVSSKVYVDETGRPLDATTMAFVFQIPIGLRLWATDKFFLFTEYKPTFEPILIGYKTDPPQLTSSDTFTLHAAPLVFGVGFGF